MMTAQEWQVAAWRDLQAERRDWMAIAWKEQNFIALRIHLGEYFKFKAMADAGDELLKRGGEQQK